MMLLSSSSRQASSSALLSRARFAPTVRPVLAPPPRAGERIGKADLVETVVAAVPGITKKDAGAAVDAVFDGIAAALAGGGEASIVGFGSFKVGERAAREGRNPRTGESIPIAASKAPKFSAGKALKDRINGETGAGAAKKPAAAAGRKTTTARAPTASATAGRKTAARRSTKSK